MTLVKELLNVDWQAVCDSDELVPYIGMRALVHGEQVALFRVRDELFGVSAIDPFTSTAVLSRGIVGDLKGQVVVTSPIYKQHFSLETGRCLEDPDTRIQVYRVREQSGRIEVAPRVAPSAAEGGPASSVGASA